MANPANARIDGFNVTQLDRLNVRNALYVEGSPVRSDGVNNIVTVTQASDLEGDLSSSVMYLVPGRVDMGSTSIVVPAGGLNIIGNNANVTGLISSEDSFTLFTSPAGGSGNLFISNLAIEVTGSGSQVYDLTDVTGNNAVEVAQINYNNCSSLGELTDYRQGLEENTGRFGGAPELTLSGEWNGFRISLGIARGLEDITALFRAGTDFTFDGRFITDINCDLPTNGALMDFAPSNVVTDEGLMFTGAFITRDGVVAPADTTIYPNIDQTSIKSDWSDNTGLPNTRKYIKGTCTTEVETVISDINTYTPLLGTITIDDSSHFDEPVNGQYRLLTGINDVNVLGDITIDGTQGNVIDIRATKSTDDGSTFPDVINHTRRVINNLAGSDDVAFFSINFIVSMSKNDRIRLEIENTSSSANVTQVEDSYLIVQAL